jgi:hypothetical protein
MTMGELLVDCRRWAESYYCAGHIAVLEMVFGVPGKRFGSTPAAAQSRGVAPRFAMSSSAAAVCAPIVSALDHDT